MNTLYPNGDKKSESYYLNNKLEGTKIIWFENGKISSVEGYKGGLRHGKSTEFNLEGSRAFEDNFAHGKLHGSSKIWNHNQELVLEEHYENGVQISDK